MTLPPVVTDPEVCPERTDQFARMAMSFVPRPHDWEKRSIVPHTFFGVCRFCGGRKP